MEEGLFDLLFCGTGVKGRWVFCLDAFTPIVTPLFGWLVQSHNA